MPVHYVAVGGHPCHADIGKDDDQEKVRQAWEGRCRDSLVGGTDGLDVSALYLR